MHHVSPGKPGEYGAFSSRCPRLPGLFNSELRLFAQEQSSSALEHGAGSSGQELLPLQATAAGAGPDNASEPVRWVGLSQVGKFPTCSLALPVKVWQTPHSAAALICDKLRSGQTANRISVKFSPMTPALRLFFICNEHVLHPVNPPRPDNNLFFAAFVNICEN
jgi:hypothetical protein